MTKQEVTKLLSVISAYYGTPKNDPDTMVKAWYILLKDYNYKIAEQAVIEYAKRDTRQYSQYPKIGVIIESIKEEQKAITVIRNFAFDDWNDGEYERLPERSKKWISKERFEKLKRCPDDYLRENLEQIRDALCKGLLITEREEQ